MKRKTLVILLIIPFIIGLLTFVSVVALNNSVAISPTIILNYGENFGFRTNGEYLLECELQFDGNVNSENSIIAEGSIPTWSLSKWSGSDSLSPEITKDENNNYYLNTKSGEGSCVITAELENGRSSASFNAFIYSNGLIIINPTTTSNNRIDDTRYYGEYDISYDSIEPSNLKKNLAKIPFSIDKYTEKNDEIRVISTSENISYNIETNEVSVLESGEAYFTLGFKEQDYIESTYRFNIIENGVNVYSYEDLMMCTNKSNEGEVVCLQINLQSLSNTYNSSNRNDEITYLNEYKNSNTKFFGIYDFNRQYADFSDLIYFQDPKIDTLFIDQFLNEGAVSPNFNYSTQMKVGIRVQKDFYGNGFNINLNELAYPNHGNIDSISGKLTPNRELDFFYGPLTYVSIGDLENLPVIRAYLCDNVGMLLDEDNIVVNDLKIQNSNSTDNMFNLGYTGTVIEAQGDNITIKNSIVEWGRTCIRGFSSDNLLIDNCILQNAGEFILKLGSNKINRINHDQNVNVRFKDQVITTSFDEFFNGTYQDVNSADYIYSDIFNSSSITGIPSNNLTNEQKIDAINDIQEALDNLDGIVNNDGSVNYDAHITVNDTYFYNSGIYSIALESSFNGPYLYNGMPYLVNTLATVFGITPKEVGGTSYPVELTLEGDTRFYDWKDVDSIDASSLIEENFSYYLEQLGKEGDTSFGDIDGANLSIDSFFPMKRILKEYAINNNLAYSEKDNEGNVHYYVNRPIAYYGGGYNASKVINNVDQNEYYSFSDDILVDIAKYVIEHDTTGSGGEVTDLLSLSTLAKCVVVAIGSNPFKFVTNGTISNNETPILFDKAPSIQDLINN